MKKTSSTTDSSLSRRDFINRMAAGTAMIAFAPVNTLLAGNGSGSWPVDAPRYRFHMIGHAHIEILTRYNVK
jgi:hypothetical protein